MRELVVVSGKGGTGKTSIVAALAALSGRALLADCDVDAANLHLALQPTVRQREVFAGGQRARIDPARCTGCGRCAEVCRFAAVRAAAPAYASGEPAPAPVYHSDPMACEGCGVCTWCCPEQAIAFEPAISGEWFVSDTRHGPMVHARLYPGGENSGKLVTLIRRQARQLAELHGLELIVVDGSPGIGCQVMASVTGADLVLIVSEPTLAGLHDFGRIADLAAHFQAPAALCINKCDLNPQLTLELERAAHDRRIGVVGRIRYTAAFTRAQRRGLSVVECDDDPAADEVRQVWAHLEPLVGDGELALNTL